MFIAPDRRPDRMPGGTPRLGSLDIARRAALLLLGGALAVLAFRFGLWLLLTLRTVRFPYGLDYGEGIVWQQALLIGTPRGYGDMSVYPFISFEYVPLFHIVVRGLAALGMDWLAAGRLISAASAAATAAVLGAVVWRALRWRLTPQAALVGAVLAGLLPYATGPVIEWARLMRIDTLAILFATLGIAATIGARVRPRLDYVAAALFVAGVYTKQTAIAAPAAAYVVLWLDRPARALRAIGCAVVLGGAILAAATIATDGRFFSHVLLNDVNRWSVPQLYWNVRQLWAEFPLVALALIGVALTWRAQRRRPAWAALRQALRLDGFALTTTLLSVWLLLALLMLLTLGKSAAASNYFLETGFIASALAGVVGAAAADLLLHAAPGDGRRAWGAAMLPLLLGVMLLLHPIPRDRRVLNPELRREMDALAAKVAAADKPVASDDMVLLMRAGKEVPFESAMISEMTAMGRFDEAPLVGMVRDGGFAFVVLDRPLSDPLTMQRYSPAMLDAIAAAYPRATATAGLLVLEPPAAPAPGLAPAPGPEAAPAGG